jgi:hypothetical protein
MCSANTRICSLRLSSLSCWLAGRISSGLPSRIWPPGITEKPMRRKPRPPVAM